MTMAEMVTWYNRMSAAHKYLLGFSHKGVIYYVMLSFNELMNYLRLDHTSASRGGYAKVRIRINAAQRDELLASDRIIAVGSTQLMEGEQYNRGERFEKLITELLTTEHWVKDNRPFWACGDIQLNGEEIQIKFDGAELTNEKTLGKRLAELTA